MPHIIREVQASYTIDINDEAIGRETIILQRDGKPVAAVVPYEEYQKLLAPESAAAPAPPISDDPVFERNRAAFQRLLPELLKTQRGQWVAIIDEKVAVVGPTSSAVLDEVIEKFGDVRMYIQEVLEKSRVYRISGPRIVRSISRGSPS